ncbi:MAG TPA: hypothetical protein VHD56_11970 [Tepidisphaeraceae bacterium]|nr:hypothetical protein [Tepidisphaeraceae bacterium]
MPKEIEQPKLATKPGSVRPPIAMADPDLSSQINAFVEKEQGEIVKCVRVFGDLYRCNWWGHEHTDKINRPLAGFDVTLLRVRKSSFLRVKKTDEGLRIEDKTLTQVHSE